MSFGNAPRGSRSGKGAGEKKSVRKKKQEFHTHKQRLRENEQQELDFAQLKARVVASLEKLGKQKLSAEPGGYDLRSWTKSLNTLLDDFEQKAGPPSITHDYLSRRRELTAVPFDSSRVAALDDEIATLRREAETLKEEEARVRRQHEERLVALESEKGRVAEELEAARNSALERAKSKSFLSSLFGGRGRPKNDATQEETRELESKLKTLEAEENTLRAKLSASSQSQDEEDPTHGDLSGRRHQIESKVAALTAEREERIQFSREREDLTAELAALVSRLPAGDAGSIEEVSGSYDGATGSGQPSVD